MKARNRIGKRELRAALSELGARGGRAGRGPAKSRSAQLRAYWQSPAAAHRRRAASAAESASSGEASEDGGGDPPSRLPGATTTTRAARASVCRRGFIFWPRAGRGAGRRVGAWRQPRADARQTRAARNAPRKYSANMRHRFSNAPATMRRDFSPCFLATAC